jgi:hypothetical protein
MRKKRERESLAEAVEQLKKQGLANPLPEHVMNEALRRLAECGMQNAASADTGQPPLRTPHSAFRIRIGLKFAAAAAVFILAGYVGGRLAAPDVDQLHDALVPSVAASLEPALRQKLGEEMKDQYQVALAAGYLRLREEVTRQYREDLSRFAMQTLAASNATTNALLAGLVQTIDTTQAQDLQRIALVLSQIEAKRVQDKTQLAAGLQTLAYRTEDELSRTKKVLARFMIDEPLPQMNPPERLPTDTQNERSEQ